MDNQQERLAWFAGIVDGEGSITMAKNPTGKSGGYTIRPLVNITNSSVPALNVIEKLMEDYGLAYYIKWLEPDKGGRKRWIWRLNIYGQKRVIRLLEVIMPYLVIKTEQAKILYDWCKYRVALEGRGQNRLYEQRDYDTQRRLSELNQNPQRLYAEHVFKITRDNNGYKREDIG
jgi:hypothetical protein